MDHTAATSTPAPVAAGLAAPSTDAPTAGPPADDAPARPSPGFGPADVPAAAGPDVASPAAGPPAATGRAASAPLSASGHVHAALPATPSSVLLPRRPLVLALAVAFTALATAAAVASGDLLLTWDEPIQRAVEARRSAGFDSLFRAVSRLGSTIPVLTLGTVLSVVTWRRCRAVGAAVLVATFARPAVEFVVKALVGRDRPDFERLVPGNGPSFPSGHVLAAVALWGLLPLVVSLYTRRRAVWWASVAVAAALVAAISASRVYLGVHWFSDVTGGLIFGNFLLLGVEAVVHHQHARHPCRHVREGPGDAAVVCGDGGDDGLAAGAGGDLAGATAG